MKKHNFLDFFHAQQFSYKPYKSLIIKDFGEIRGFKDTRCSGHHEIATSNYRKVGWTPEMDFSQEFEKV